MGPHIARDARRVRVPGRDDVGIVISEGVNLGGGSNVYCIAVYFPGTGEVAHFEKGREQVADD